MSKSKQSNIVNLYELITIPQSTNEYKYMNGYIICCNLNILGANRIPYHFIHDIKEYFYLDLSIHI